MESSSVFFFSLGVYYGLQNHGGLAEVRAGAQEQRYRTNAEHGGRVGSKLGQGERGYRVGRGEGREAGPGLYGHGEGEGEALLNLLILWRREQGTCNLTWSVVTDRRL